MSIKKAKKTKAPESKKKPAKASKPAPKKPSAKTPVSKTVNQKAKPSAKTEGAPKSASAKKIPPAAPPKAVASPKIEPTPAMNKPKAPAPAQAHAKPKPKASKKDLDEDLPLDLEEKEDLFEEEKQELAKALREDEEDTFDASFIPTDTSERYILVVDEEGKRRNETVTIISQILPNAIVEVADDPEEAAEIMQDCDFDTFVVNFLMPGYSASPFVKSVANHFEHPLLLGFAADKISDAVDPKKGLKIIPLKRLFDLDANLNGESPTEGTRG